MSVVCWNNSDWIEQISINCRIRGRIHSKWGRLVASPSRSLSWICPRSSVSWTDQTNKACATCRLDCIGRIKNLLWVWTQLLSLLDKAGRIQTRQFDLSLQTSQSANGLINIHSGGNRYKAKHELISQGKWWERLLAVTGTVTKQFQNSYMNVY